MEEGLEAGSAACATLCLHSTASLSLNMMLITSKPKGLKRDTLIRSCACDCDMFMRSCKASWSRRAHGGSGGGERGGGLGGGLGGLYSIHANYLPALSACASA